MVKNVVVASIAVMCCGQKVGLSMAGLFVVKNVSLSLADMCFEFDIADMRCVQNK